MKIDEHLNGKYAQGKNFYGRCTHCQQPVEWRSASVSSHIRSTFPEATQQMKEQFAKKSQVVVHQITNHGHGQATSSLHSATATSSEIFSVTTPATKKARVDSQTTILSFLDSMTATEQAVIDEKFA
jgi:hypothetical protein